MKLLFKAPQASYDPSLLVPGTTVRVHQLIKEGEKTRVQIYEGKIIARKGKTDTNSTITVRRISIGNVGVERIFPLFSPLISQIEVVKKPNTVRRAKLYYLRDRKGDSMKLSEHSFKATISLQPTEIDEENLEVIETIVSSEDNDAIETVDTSETPETQVAPVA